MTHALNGLFLEDTSARCLAERATNVRSRRIFPTKPRARFEVSSLSLSLFPSFNFQCLLLLLHLSCCNRAVRIKFIRRPPPNELECLR